MKIYSINSFNPKSDFINTKNQNNLVASRPNFRGGSDVIVKNAKNIPVEFDSEAAEKLISIFSSKFNKLPKGLNLTVSQSTGSIISYSKDLEDNRVIKAIKKAAESNRKNYLYIIFKEFQNGILKDSLAVDMNGELIRLKSDGTVSILKGDFVRYDKNCTELKYAKHCRKIKEYAAAIFKNNSSLAENTVVTANSITKQEVETKRTWRIANAEYDDLPNNVQKSLIEINETLLNLSKLIDARRGMSSKIVRLKMDYEPIIYVNKKQKNTTFKYRNLESLAILHSKSNEKYTRIIHTNSHGVETHILIEDNKKVVSNLNKKRPWVVPEKYRYMTRKEIELSNVEAYVKFLSTQVKKYYEYMFENLGGMNVTHRRHFTNSKEELDNFMNEVTEKISANLNSMQNDIEKRADNDANEFVSKYFRNFAISFEQYSKEGLKDFRKKLEAYIEKITASKENESAN